jgi:hypothetical protein
VTIDSKIKIKIKIKIRKKRRELCDSPPSLL